MLLSGHYCEITILNFKVLEKRASAIYDVIVMFTRQVQIALPGTPIEKPWSYKWEGGYIF